VSQVGQTARTALLGVEADARRARRRTRIQIWAGRGLILAALLTTWQLTSGRLVVAGLSNPVQIAGAWWRLASTGLLLTHAQVTLVEFALGLVIGTLLGLTAAVVLGAGDLAYRLVEPYLVAFYGIPKLALVPLFVLWFGTGLVPKIVLVAMISFFLVLVSTVAGLRSVRQELVGAMHVLGAGRFAVFRYASIPHALPFVLAALRISIPSAMAGAVLAEFLSSGEGLGYLISQASDYLDSAQVMALVLTLGGIVLACRLLLVPIERWVNRFQGGVI
jgi:NitT/TauT family transport system permease protein